MQRLAGLFLAFLAAACAGLAGSAARADPATPSAHAVTTLAAQSAGAAPGSTLWVAVVQRLDRGWHTYWRNPGDAGEPTTIRWTLPPGWKAGDIAWPTPKRLPVGPIMNYGYEEKTVFPVPLEVPRSARVGDQARLAASVDYLICAEVCIPEHAAVDAVVPVVAGAPPPDPTGGLEIAAALAAVPKPSALTARFQAAGPRLSLAIVGAPVAAAPARDAYFFPYGESLIDHGKPQTIERGPGGLTLTMSTGGAFSKGGAPANFAGVLSLDGKAYEVTALPGPPPPGASGLGPPAPEAGAAQPWPALAAPFALALAGAFLGGLILNLMPCVFPILSMKAVALAGHAGEADRARAQALAFLGGVLASFLSLAVALEVARTAGEAVGWGFQLQSPAAVSLLSLVILAAALNLSGLFEVGVTAQGFGSGVASRGGLAGSAFTGALAVVVAAPCTAPFMGPALGFALIQPAPVALAVFLSLGLGFAAPFTLLSLSPALIRALPRPGPWMDLLRRALAFPMYGAAAWLAWVLAQETGPAGLARLLAAAVVLAFAAWLFGLGQRRASLGRDVGAIGLHGGAAIGVAAAIALVVLGGAIGDGAAMTAGGRGAPAAGGIASQTWSPERLAALRAARTPVLVNFTAAWCVTCQVNERVVFSTREVARALDHAGAVYLVADWTRRDAAIAKALSDEGRVGVPLYLVYGADGGPPQVLPQLLTPSLVAQALNRAAAPRA
jgi:thiol:disulfide interchange protein DsbD